MKKLFCLLSILLMFGCGSTSQAQNYKTHKVKRGETIESIAKIYKVTPYDIYTLNPDAKKELKRNSVLLIPNAIGATNAPQAAIEKELSGFKNHKVKRKETLYSLSKEYHVTEDEIKKHNSFLYANNLRKGDEIKIPIYKKVLKITEPEATTKTYTVLPKEGKWRIAYKFGITVAELEALNPELKPILQVGETINVPNITTNNEKAIDNQYSYYEVLPKEGFYRLKIKLGLEQSELEALNPELIDSGLKVGMVLKVPYNSAVEDVNTSLKRVDLTTSVFTSETKNLAIMLPFKLNKVDIDSVADTKAQIHTDPFLSTSLDFYSGMVVALDSLERLGVTLNVDVYDTKNMASEVSHILNTNNFENVHAVIGPLMPDHVNRVSSALKQFRVPVVSPITKHVELLENVFQSRPSEDLLRNKIVNHIKSDSTINKMIIIADTDNTKVSNDLKLQFPSAAQLYSQKDEDGNDAFYIYDTDIIPQLKPGKNVVFLETSHSGFVSNVTSRLNALISEDQEIILVTTNMGSAFEDDEVSNYHLSNLQFTFPAIAKTYNEDDANSFANAYIERFGITPNKVAVRGFDITMDIVLRIVAFNNLYESINQAPLTEYVENKFAYKKKLFGGFYNNTVYLVKYQDLTIEEIKPLNQSQD